MIGKIASSLVLLAELQNATRPPTAINTRTPVSPVALEYRVAGMACRDHPRESSQDQRLAGRRSTHEGLGRDRRPAALVLAIPAATAGAQRDCERHRTRAFVARTVQAIWGQCYRRCVEPGAL